MKVLYVEDHWEYRERVSKKLREIGLEVFEAEGCREAREQIASHPDIGIVFWDGRVSDGETYSGLVQEVKERFPAMKLVAASGGSQSELMKAGCTIAIRLDVINARKGDTLTSYLMEMGIL